MVQGCPTVGRGTGAGCPTPETFCFWISFANWQSVLLWSPWSPLSFPSWLPASSPGGGQRPLVSEPGAEEHATTMVVA